MWLQQVHAGVSSLAFRADGQALYVCDTRGRVTAWDMPTRTSRQLFRIECVGRPGPDLHTASDDRFLVLRLPSSIYVWDIASGAEHVWLPLEPNGYPPSLDHTGRLLVAPDAQRQVLTTWDVAARKPGPPLLRADPT